LHAQDHADPASLDFQPRPAYPYSPGAAAGGFIYTAGQVAWGPDGNVVAVGDVRAQTKQTLANVLAVLTEGGATPDDVVKCNVYLADMRHFDIMNEEFAKGVRQGPAGAHHGAGKARRGGDAGRDRGHRLHRPALTGAPLRPPSQPACPGKTLCPGLAFRGPALVCHPRACPRESGDQARGKQLYWKLSPHPSVIPGLHPNSSSPGLTRGSQTSPPRSVVPESAL
jgi:2-iminobutanoate/2-iminopropanoate deaminase